MESNILKLLQSQEQYRMPFRKLCFSSTWCASAETQVIKLSHRVSGGIQWPMISSRSNFSIYYCGRGSLVFCLFFVFFLLCKMILLPNRKTFKHTSLLSGITNWSSNLQCWKQAEKKFSNFGCCSTSWVKMAEVKSEGYWHGARCYIPHLSNEC